jgi:hypothetical protein
MHRHIYPCQIYVVKHKGGIGVHYQTNQVAAEPYVFQLLQGLIGGRVVVESLGDSYRGILIDAKPDHIAVLRWRFCFLY